jgi:Nucleotidyl transferase AbiEii toxin, Type IV TA system
MPEFVPRLDILPPAQRALWDELHATPPQFTLYGGTALALHLGHRQSVDFDFFSSAPFEPSQLLASVAYLKDAHVIDAGLNTLTCRVDRGDPIKLQFFGGLPLASIEARFQTFPGAVLIASLIDLAATKIKVLPERSERKDYLDIAALLEHGMKLPVMLAAANAVYGSSYNPLLSLKALTYFDDVAILPDDVKTRLTEASLAVELDQLPAIVPRYPRLQGQDS